MSRQTLRDLICSMQKNCVMDLFPSTVVKDYIDKGLFKDENDWVTCTALGKEVLSHDCTERCLIRIGDGDGPENFRCRKKHPVYDSIEPLNGDFIPIKYKFSSESLDILEDIGLYTPDRPGSSTGTFKPKALRPTRHMGVVNPAATDNMSPTNPELFAALRSMQNLQVITDTNGVSRYVVKYIVKMDQG